MSGVFIKEVMDFIFPNYSCLICRDELNSPTNQFLCNDCASKLPLNNNSIVLRDSSQKQFFNKAFCAFEYKDDIASLILRLKYNSEKSVAEAFAPFVADKISNTENAVLIPVPLSIKRQKQRGYNQAQLLATKLGELLNMSVVCDTLIRIKATEAQKKMSIKQRAENLKDAFEVCNVSMIKDKIIWLVDDVFTSGATVNECARMLKSAGVSNVNVVTIATAIHN